MEKVDQSDANPCILNGDNRQKTHAWNGDGDYEACVGDLQEFAKSKDCQVIFFFLLLIIILLYLINIF